ncbi:hypothetical protein [Reichenbachiella ulvae]|uniref:DUF4595 domain-containing protein n=1 Tax=Reichenbachiella ulvae TaxID=2980104 RepID=A0ABT3CYX2_9BACT|nr:hypothetical protein [Reichenbachiella ulvae]MCV9388784.1 hypothetical protein [Reichenbachiella ulvae]
MYLKQKISRLGLVLIGISILVSCKEEETPNYNDKQILTVSLDGNAYVLKDGEEFTTSGDKNAIFSAHYDEIDRRLSFETYSTSINGLEYLKVSMYAYDWWYGEGGIRYENEGVDSNGNLKLNHEVQPYSLFFEIQAGGERYISEVGTGMYTNYDEYLELLNYQVEADEVSAYMMLTDLFSNGTEKYVDGQKLDYPNERFAGVISIPFVDQNGISHDLDLDFDIRGENVVHGEIDFESSGPSSCPVGSYRIEVCNGYYQYLHFYSDGSGKAVVEDCTGQCEAVNEFNWTADGSQIHYNFTKSYGCGVEVDPPAPSSDNYSCEDDGITVNGNYLVSY